MYSEVAPPAWLAPYIDAYWFSATGAGQAPSVTRILPDTCTDILINLGSDIRSLNRGTSKIEGGKCYLIGTMTTYSDVLHGSGSSVFGIRFRPFGMHALLGFSLSGTGNSQAELSAREFDFRKFMAGGNPDIPALDKYFTGRLPEGGGSNAVKWFRSIQESKGLISVSTLARQHHISERQLERLFAEKTGVTVKELCGQVRMQHAIRAIKNKPAAENLLGISLSTGYYDHAHLSKSLKKYTGYTPSHFMR